MTKLLFYAYFLVAFASHSAAGQLHDAVKDGNVAQVRLLIANGEDVNKSQKFLGAPLHQAAIRGSVEIAELLLAAGADVDVENPIFGTPLHVAAQKGDEAVAIVLIGKGANVESRHQDGTTPLIVAAEGGHVSMVELLIANGADVNSRRTAMGDTPDYAPTHAAGLNGHFDIVDLLRAYGAKGPKVEPVANLLATASTSNGEMLFNNSCGGCHSVERDGGVHRGPGLWNVLGRKKASLPGFEYSEAFSRLVGKWTFAELNAYITSPTDYVPGTAMGIGGVTTSVRDPAQRADLIAFLRTKSDDPPPFPAYVSGK